IAAPHRGIDLRRRVDEIEYATRAVHHVEVELLRQSLPELERKLVEMRVWIEMVVGANDRRVASGVAAAEPALFQHRDVADAMLFREVIRGGEPMTAATDDDDIVVLLRRSAAPCGWPALVAAERIADEGEDRIALHIESRVRDDFCMSDGGGRCFEK